MQEQCHELSSKLDRTEQELATLQAKFTAVSGVAKALEQKLSSNKGMVSNVDQRIQNISQQSKKSAVHSIQQLA